MNRAYAEKNGSAEPAVALTPIENAPKAVKTAKNRVLLWSSPILGENIAIIAAENARKEAKQYNLTIYLNSEVAILADVAEPEITIVAHTIKKAFAAVIIGGGKTEE